MIAAGEGGRSRYLVPEGCGSMGRSMVRMSTERGSMHKRPPKNVGDRCGIVEDLEGTGGGVSELRQSMWGEGGRTRRDIGRSVQVSTGDWERGSVGLRLPRRISPKAH